MRALKALVERNLINFFRDKARLIVSIVMPVVLVFVFSFITKSTEMGLDQPMNYLIAGVIIMTVFQSAVANAASVIDDIATGFLKEIIIAPIARWQICIGQILSSTFIAVLQGLTVMALGLCIGLRLGFWQFLQMSFTMAIVGFTFSSIGLYLATLAKSNTAFQMIVMVMMMPLSFLSGALIPTTAMPKLLQPLVYLNPLTYTTAMFRYITLQLGRYDIAELLRMGVAFSIHGFTISPYMGLVLVVAMGIPFFILGVRQFTKADFSTVKAFDPHRL